jgi:hypothetical protein
MHNSQLANVLNTSQASSSPSSSVSYPPPSSSLSSFDSSFSYNSMRFPGHHPLAAPNEYSLPRPFVELDSQKVCFFFFYGYLYFVTCIIILIDLSFYLIQQKFWCTEHQWEHELINDPQNGYLHSSYLPSSNCTEKLFVKKPSLFLNVSSSTSLHSPLSSPVHDNLGGVIEDLDYVVSLNSYADLSHIPDLSSNTGGKLNTPMAICYCSDSTDIFRFYVSNAPDKLRDALYKEETQMKEKNLDEKKDFQHCDSEVCDADNHNIDSKSNNKIHAVEVASSFSKTFGFLGASGDAAVATEENTTDFEFSSGGALKQSNLPIVSPISTYPSTLHSKSPLASLYKSPTPTPSKSPIHSPLPSHTPQSYDTDKAKLNYGIVEQPLFIAAFIVPGKAHIYHLHHRKTREDLDAVVPSTTPILVKDNVFIF